MNVLTVLGKMFVLQAVTFASFDIVKAIVNLITSSFNKDKSKNLLKGVTNSKMLSGSDKWI